MFKISDNNDILISRGETVIFSVPIRGEDGMAYSLKSNQHLYMAVKKEKNDTQAVQTWTSVDGSNEIQISSKDTLIDNLTAGEYWYDIVAITKVGSEETERRYLTFPRRFTIVGTIG